MSSVLMETVTPRSKNIKPTPQKHEENCKELSTLPKTGDKSIVRAVRDKNMKYTGTKVKVTVTVTSCQKQHRPVDSGATLFTY